MTTSVSRSLELSADRRHQCQLALPGLAPDPPRRPRRRPLEHVARSSGHRMARCHAGRLADRVMTYLRQAGPSTDQQLAERLGLALSSVNATRNALIKRGVVHAVGVVAGPFGALRTLWDVR